MNRSYIYRILSLAALLISAASCVYPFEADLPASEKSIVIEGNILVGEVCTFTMSYTINLNDKSSTEWPSGKIWIECEDGKVYEDKNSTKHSFEIDLTNASADKKYRLKAKNTDTGLEYETPFMEVLEPAVIDELSYIPNPTKNHLAIALSMHSPGNQYFRWSYKENWEYHAYYNAELYYDQSSNRVFQYTDGQNVYYCWGSDSSKDIMIFSTADQTEDKFVDLEFHTIPRKSLKIQYIYYIEVKLEAMTEECYKYWNNILQNSNEQGNFFSPTPSQMAGNIACTDNTKSYAIGYINAAKSVKANLYYLDSENRFHEDQYSAIPEAEEIESSKWGSSYRNGYRPVWTDPLEESAPVYWAPREYCDCRVSGGNKNKPSFWPNDHK